MVFDHPFFCLYPLGFSPAFIFMLYDLHSHSNCSDGTLTPAELVARAKQKGVDVLALTDHDTVAGIEQAQTAAQQQGIKLLPGVEISVTWRDRLIHIVGLNIDIHNQQLIDGLAYNRSLRHKRALKMAEKLEKKGIKGVLEGVKQHAGEAAITRTHFARFLVEQGYAKNIDEVFRKFIVSGKPGFVKMQWIDMPTAIKWIVDAGGIAVIAHPGRYKMTRAWLGRLFNDFIAAGGKAIEVNFSSSSKDEISKFAQLAKDYQLLASSGSDFHDPETNWLDLGMHKSLPQSVTPVWEGQQWA